MCFPPTSLAAKVMRGIPGPFSAKTLVRVRPSKVPIARMAVGFLIFSLLRKFGPKMKVGKPGFNPQISHIIAWNRDIKVWIFPKKQGIPLSTRFAKGIRVSEPYVFGLAKRKEGRFERRLYTRSGPWVRIRKRECHWRAQRFGTLRILPGARNAVPADVHGRAVGIGP